MLQPFIFTLAIAILGGHVLAKKTAKVAWSNQFWPNPKANNNNPAWTMNHTRQFIIWTETVQGATKYSFKGLNLTTGKRIFFTQEDFQDELANTQPLVFKDVAVFVFGKTSMIRAFFLTNGSLARQQSFQSTPFDISNSAVPFYYQIDEETILLLNRLHTTVFNVTSWKIIWQVLNPKPYTSRLQKAIFSVAFKVLVQNFVDPTKKNSLLVAQNFSRGDYLWEQQAVAGDDMIQDIYGGKGSILMLEKKGTSSFFHLDTGVFIFNLLQGQQPCLNNILSPSSNHSMIYVPTIELGKINGVDVDAQKLAWRITRPEIYQKCFIKFGFVQGTNETQFWSWNIDVENKYHWGIFDGKSGRTVFGIDYPQWVASDVTWWYIPKQNKSQPFYIISNSTTDGRPFLKGVDPSGKYLFRLNDSLALEKSPTPELVFAQLHSKFSKLDPYTKKLKWQVDLKSWSSGTFKSMSLLDYFNETYLVRIDFASPDAHYMVKIDEIDAISEVYDFESPTLW